MAKTLPCVMGKPWHIMVNFILSLVYEDYGFWDTARTTVLKSSRIMFGEENVHFITFHTIEKQRDCYRKLKMRSL
jgi:hypothetical protein